MVCSLAGWYRHGTPTEEHQLDAAGIVAIITAAAAAVVSIITAIRGENVRARVQEHVQDHIEASSRSRPTSSQ